VLEDCKSSMHGAVLTLRFGGGTLLKVPHDRLRRRHLG